MIKKINYIFNKKQKIHLGILLFLILVSSVLELVGVAIVIPFINILLNPDKFMKNVIVQELCKLLKLNSIEDVLVLICIGIILAYIIKNAFLIVKEDLQFKFTYNNQRKLSNQLMTCYIYQPYLFHINHNSAELIRNITADTTSFYRVVLAILQLTTEVVISILLFAFLFLTDPTITICIGLLFVIYSYVFSKGFKKKRTHYGELSREYTADMHKSLYQAFGGIKEIKILNRELYFTNVYNRSYERYSNVLRKDNVLGVVSKPLLESLCITVLFAVISIKIITGAEIATFLPILSTFAVAAFKIMPSFNRIILNIGIINFSKSAIESVYNDLNELKKLNEAVLTNASLVSDFTITDYIEIKNITFKYPMSQDNVLENISFNIKKNSSVALVGSSGTGKTTLIDIILGLLTPQSGKINTGKINILDNVYNWHKKIGYIPQTIYLTDDTIRRNIAFGYSDSEIEDELIWKSLELAQLKEHIQELENGLDTVIGESGIKLSGGQRQRIGIARALYLNPEILVLDEATSSLDNDTEAAIMDAINKLAGKKTLIIIAHRLTTIEKCDVVYEINNKKIYKKR